MVCFSRVGVIEVERNGLFSDNMQEVGFRGFCDELGVGKVASLASKNTGCLVAFDFQI